MGEELKEELKEGERARRIISWTGVQPNGGRKKGVTVMRVPEQCGSQGFWEFAYTSLRFPTAECQDLLSQHFNHRRQYHDWILAWMHHAKVY